MTQEQRDKIIKTVVNEKADFSRECETQKMIEQGKILGAEYMLQTIIDALMEEPIVSHESEVEK